MLCNIRLIIKLLIIYYGKVNPEQLNYKMQTAFPILLKKNRLHIQEKQLCSLQKVKLKANKYKVEIILKERKVFIE